MSAGGDPDETERANPTPLGPWLVLLGVVLVTLVLAGGWRSNDTASVPAEGQTLELAAVLSAESNDFAMADRVRTFRFPDDHGPHPDFRSEWWYFTGNLTNKRGRRFGFQLTFFRFALSGGPEKSPGVVSRWTSDQVYMAHFAVSDGARRRFHAFEQFEREALGLAGAQAQPFRVWLGPWEARSTGTKLFPLRLSAEKHGTALELTINSGKPVVLQGDRGLSQKSARPGNASYYYSFTRLPASGQLRVDGEQHEVRGDVWVDREWSSSALDSHQVGWDWIALQLDDGRDLMFYRLRTKDGQADPHSAGSLVEAGGAVRYLGVNDVRLRPTRHWQGTGGVRYPVEWQLRIPAYAIDLRISPLFAAQEHLATLRYWEGAVDAVGSSNGRAVAGRGYLELTGYVPSR